MRSPTTVPGARFIEPQALARISSLELLARTVVHGFINGLHRAPHLGASMDFAEHRAYEPGDDLRRIDWKVYARTDRYYVKEYEAETNANFAVALDISRSMRWKAQGVTKLDYARYLAATLTYFSSRQRDRVGLVTYDESGVRDFIPPSAKHLESALYALDRAGSGRGTAADAAHEGARDGQTRTARWWRPRRRDARAHEAAATGIAAVAALDVMLVVADRLRRRGILAVISDFYEEPERVRDALQLLRSKGQDVIAFHVLDPAELEFPYDEATSFEDVETGERMPVAPAKLRQRYRTLVREHIDALRTLLTAAGCDYVQLATAEPLDRALFDYLAMRQRLMKVR
jgi:uncharacterized protein (DUF58 family)